MPVLQETPSLMSQTVRGMLRRAARLLPHCAGTTAECEARWLLAHVTGWDTAQMVLHAGEVLPWRQYRHFWRLVARRRAREPIQYLLHTATFHGLPFHVDPRVLIPRPETEILVDEAGKRLQGDEGILDVGVGSGCILFSLCHGFPRLHGTGIDISRDALAVARRNAVALCVDHRVALLRGDLFEPVRNQRFAVILSNPPYVARGDKAALQAEVRDYEPAPALYGGEDGLAVIRRLLQTAPCHLAPRGVLLFEFGLGQARAIREMTANVSDVYLEAMIPDQADIPRVAVLRRR